jgi:Arc/MetJ-type ribon-helix-helix transcriptional regulator
MFSVKLSVADYARVERLVANLGVSKAEIVRRGLRRVEELYKETERLKELQKPTKEGK